VAATLVQGCHNLMLLVMLCILYEYMSQFFSVGATFSLQWLWRLLSSWIWCSLVW